MAYKAQDFIDALPNTGGVISALARKVGCDWNTAKAAIEKYPTVRERWEAEKSTIDDAARSVVINDIVQSRNVETAKWWLRMKLSDEFSDKQRVEHTGADGGAIQIAPVAIDYRAAIAPLAPEQGDE